MACRKSVIRRVGIKFDEVAKKLAIQNQENYTRVTDFIAKEFNNSRLKRRKQQEEIKF